MKTVSPSSVAVSASSEACFDGINVFVGVLSSSVGESIDINVELQIDLFGTGVDDGLGVDGEVVISDEVLCQQSKWHHGKDKFLKHRCVSNYRH